MPRPLLLVLAGSLIAFLPASIPAPGQNSQAPVPAQSQSSPATPAPAMPPTQTVTPAPVTYPKNPVKPTADSQTKAKNLYQIDCAMCHGDNGNGKSDLATSMELTLSDWTNPKTLADLPDGELFLVIRNGKDKMPPEAQGRASDEAIWNLVIYIRGFSKAQAASGSAR
jgi:mono/diheme cytochrome c family protein